METLPPTILVAVGTVIAAFITGAISFVNLLISKDQKTSEFRQQWIDALRDDISRLTGLVIAFRDRFSFQGKLVEENDNSSWLSFAESNSIQLDEIHELHHRVKLRANPKEHENLLKLIDKYVYMFTESKKYSVNDVEEFSLKVINESQVVLKKEWRRVKYGETTYRITKAAALIVFLTILLVGLGSIAGVITFEIPTIAAK